MGVPPGAYQDIGLKGAGQCETGRLGGGERRDGARLRRQVDHIVEWLLE